MKRVKEILQRRLKRSDSAPDADQESARQRFWRPQKINQKLGLAVPMSRQASSIAVISWIINLKGQASLERATGIATLEKHLPDILGIRVCCGVAVLTFRHPHTKTKTS